MNSELYSRIYATLDAVPAGFVTTYGTIAKLAGCGPRQVGQALRALPKDTKLPWFRVINSSGCISLPPGYGYEVQRERLEQEGIEFNLKGRINLRRFGWHLADG